MAELTQRVPLTSDGKTLNPAAAGWARQAIVDTSGLAGGWGRNKRWEYWAVLTPTHVLGMTVSAIDYAGVHEIWLLDRVTGEQVPHVVTVPFARGAILPGSLGEGVASATAKDFRLSITPTPAGWVLRGETARVAFDVTVAPGKDCLAVVVPWSSKRFQYTVKDVGLTASGTLVFDGERHALEGIAVLDHGRGRWPYDVHWNWGIGHGVSENRTVGLQVGGKWTDGTGQTENGVFIDGVLHKIEQEVRWEYDTADFMSPWRVGGGGLDAIFTPQHHKHAETNLLVLSGETDQLFGTWSGTFTTETSEIIRFEGLDGFAEAVHNRW